MNGNNKFASVDLASRSIGGEFVDWPDDPPRRTEFRSSTSKCLKNYWHDAKFFPESPRNCLEQDTGKRLEEVRPGMRSIAAGKENEYRDA